jgi:hypothetical protein
MLLRHLQHVWANGIIMTYKKNMPGAIVPCYSAGPCD